MDPNTASRLAPQNDEKRPVTYAAIPSEDLEQLRVGHAHARMRTKRRRLFKFSMITLFVLGMFYIHSGAHDHVKRHCGFKKPHHSDAAVEEFPGLHPESEIIIECPPWDSLKHDDEKDFHFEFPIEDDTALFLVNKHNDRHGRHFETSGFSALPSGTIKYVVDSKGLVASDKVHFDLKATKVDNLIEDHVHVCSVEAKGDGKKHPKKAVGVALATDRAIPSHYKVPFEITVTFPSTSSLTGFLLRSELKVHGFFAKVPFFNQDFSDLAGKVSFETLAVDSALADITAESLYAETLFLRTANGAIEGNFTADGHLHLSTANGPIKANITVRPNENDDPTKLIVTTANGAIDTNFILKSRSSDSSPGTFNVLAKTANGALNVNFESAPVDSSLYVQASTAHANANIKLHETYEGGFHLGTALGSTIVNERNDVEDPKGKKRTRRVFYDQKTAWSTTGSVAWEDEGSDFEGKGKIELTTALGDAVLDL